MTSGIDLGAYLSRIGANETTGLHGVHRAHLGAIPFENLDPHNAIPVELDTESVQAKLVRARRGGYCFEQNTLLKAALERLGYSVALHLARPRWNVPADMPRTHLVLAVDDGGVSWLCDVGFGAGSLCQPVPFRPGPARPGPARRTVQAVGLALSGGPMRWRPAPAELDLGPMA